MIKKLDLIRCNYYIDDLKKIGKYLYGEFGVIWDFYKILYYWEAFSEDMCASFLIVNDETLKWFKEFLEEEMI